jgi:Flp pilus assembly protein TadD
MRSATDAASLLRTCRTTLGIAGVLMLVGCATQIPPAAKGAKHTEVAGIQQDEGGFTLTEDVHVAGDVRTDYDSAIRLLEQKQYEQGIPLLVKVTQSAPDLTAAHVDLGIAYSRSGDLEKAQVSLKRALELNPRHPVAYNELGLVYRRKGEFAAARASYEKALEVFPGFHFARLNLAILCDLYLADRSCALDNYVAYSQAVPEDKQAPMWIADLRARANQ